jgi:hypothetical protein
LGLNLLNEKHSLYYYFDLENSSKFSPKKQNTKLTNSIIHVDLHKYKMKNSTPLGFFPPSILLFSRYNELIRDNNLN